MSNENGELRGMSGLLLLLAGIGGCNACNNTDGLNARLKAIEARLPVAVDTKK